MDQLLFLFLLEMVLVTLTQLQLLVEILRQILYLFDLRPHLHLNHQQLFLLDIDSLCPGDVAIEVFEAVTELAVFHVVKIIDFLFELPYDYRSFRQKCL